MGTVFLRRLSRWQAEIEREDVGDLFTDALRDEPGVRAPDREAFIRWFVDHDVQQDGFDMIVAGGPALVGCAYGFRAERGGRWWESFTEGQDGLPAVAAARQVFVVTGPVVAPGRRRGQIGTRLHRELLSRNGTLPQLALLQPGNAPARAAFQSWGWGKAGQLTPRDADGTPVEAWARLPA
ncbi:hypothetical protein [Streptomyces marincola]|uniref:N-acetyltransferase domain-containing protein n=1 Tax=Streptomyces marincola TaxID=2878388 RepID=A0A1W7CUW8_9ACTN|nr:hypothetical protein [Streptomyces marincola]ARQ68591.1 hypothetical protein CAG99_06730 [Streptomyces marincola]